MKVLKYLAVILLLVLMAGCSGGFNLFGPKPMVEVELKDAPPAEEFQEVWVNIKKVAVVMSDEDNPDEGELITIAEFEDGKKKLDLLTLQNTTDVLGSAELEPGTYQQIRMIVHDAGNFVKKDDVETEMSIASGAQTGLKIVIPGGVTLNNGDVLKLLIDWDLTSQNGSKIIKQPDETYKMTPVLKLDKQEKTAKSE